MLELVRTTIANNAKLAVVGVAAFALGGAGTVASVTLSGNQSTPPATAHSDSPDAEETQDPAEPKEAAETKEAADTGVRPTDTHGYCVSQAVAAAHTAGKAGKDVAAAAHSCAKPGKSTATHGKSAQPHGKSAQPHGKSAQPHGKASTRP